jgi:hypothetical protein
VDRSTYDLEPVSGFEPLTVRLQEGLCFAESDDDFTVIGPLACMNAFQGWLDHVSSRAAVCRIMPFCPWVSCGRYSREPGLVGILWGREEAAHGKIPRFMTHFAIRSPAMPGKAHTDKTRPGR